MRIAITVLAAVVFIFSNGCKQPAQSEDLLRESSIKTVTGQQPAEAQAEIPAFEQPRGELTLEQAAAATLLNNPKLKAFALDKRISEARELQAAAPPNPELGVEIENFGGSGDYNSFDSAETTFELSRIIELGGKLEKRKNAASLDTELADLEYQSAKLEVLTELAIAYIDTAAMQKKALMLDELVKLADSVHVSVSKQVQAGKGTAVDTAKAAIEAASAKMEHQQALRQLEYSKKLLASYWAADEPLFDSVKADFKVDGQLPDFEKLRGLMRNSPRLLKLQTEITKSKAVADMEKAYSKPDITISGGVKMFNDTNDSAFVVGISIPLPVSDINRGKRLEAAHNLAKSYELQRQQQIETGNVFNEIQANLTNSLSTAMELADNILPQTQQILDASQKAYTEGKAGYMEVLDTQRMYLEKQTEYIEAASQYHKSVALIEGVTGQVLEK